MGVLEQQLQIAFRAPPLLAFAFEHADERPPLLELFVVPLARLVKRFVALLAVAQGGLGAPVELRDLGSDGVELLLRAVHLVTDLVLLLQGAALALRQLRRPRVVRPAMEVVPQLRVAHRRRPVRRDVALPLALERGRQAVREVVRRGNHLVPLAFVRVLHLRNGAVELLGFFEADDEVLGQVAERRLALRRQLLHELCEALPQRTGVTAGKGARLVGGLRVTH
mmetsp:Transcript_84/g.292  ORF Transcript_84/g.292 Transcript_84/m.292 type:complete len:224 (-) Transcript_84:442-1113(-)